MIDALTAGDYWRLLVPRALGGLALAPTAAFVVRQARTNKTKPLAQSERFVRAVGGPAWRHVFTAEEGAEGHCQTGNLAYSAAVSMDWLDELFGA